MIQDYKNKKQGTFLILIIELWDHIWLLPIWHLQVDEHLTMWQESLNSLPVSKREVLVLVTQVPGCLYASPFYLSRLVYSRDAGHLSDLCLSIQEQKEEKQEITEWRKLVLTNSTQGKHLFAERVCRICGFHIHGPN